MKPKTKPSIRENKRYIIFRVHSEKEVNYSNMKNAVWNSLTRWLGAKGLAGANVRIIRNLWDEKKQTGVIRTSHRFVDQVKVGLGLIHQIGDERVIFQTLMVSGTIKSGLGKIKQQLT